GHSNCDCCLGCVCAHTDPALGASRAYEFRDTVQGVGWCCATSDSRVGGCCCARWLDRGHVEHAACELDCDGDHRVFRICRFFALDQQTGGETHQALSC